MDNKGHEKMTMTKKGSPEFSGKNERMIEVKSTTSKKGHKNLGVKLFLL